MSVSRSLLFSVAVVGVAMMPRPSAAADMTQAGMTQVIGQGFYIGANGGGGWAHYSRDGHYDGYSVNDSNDHGGYFAGVQAGYNMPLGHNMLLGVEGDFQGSNFKETFTCGAGYSGGSCNDSSSVAGYDIKAFGTLRARLGYTMGHWMPYVTGGLAFGDVQYDAFDYLPNNSKSKSTWMTGYAVGGGVEYAIQSHWSVKAEYLHLDFGKKSINPIPGDNYGVDVHARADVFRVGINYRF